jgi:hypothetical protein
VKSVSRGRRGKKRDVDSGEESRELKERRGEEKKKEKRKASVLLLPLPYDLVRTLVGNTLPV